MGVSIYGAETVIRTHSLSVRPIIRRSKNARQFHFELSCADRGLEFKKPVASRLRPTTLTEMNELRQRRLKQNQGRKDEKSEINPVWQRTWTQTD